MNQVNTVVCKGVHMRYPYFTVLTPTYNRAHTLHRVYDSLLAQTFQDFEWLIVDDGSTDDTETLVLSWIREKYLDIRYVKKNNGGKHTAINIGVAEAKGEMIVIIDSDDQCETFMLEKFKYYWDSIPISERAEFAGVVSLARHFDGQIVGNCFPLNIMDGAIYDVSDRYHGDKLNLIRTDIMKLFPFPVFEGEKFIAEGLIWSRISQTYKFRHINEILMLVDYQHDGLSANSLNCRLQSPLGTLLYYKEACDLPVIYSMRLKNVINFFRFGFHFNKTRVCFIQSPSFPYALLGFFMGGIAYFYDCIRKKR
jgi:glycosyltransferase involved in cell wall biosynthesis